MSRSLLSATRDRFSFPTGRSGFRQKAALILFPEEMRRSADRRYDCQRATRPFEWAQFLGALASRRRVPAFGSRLAGGTPALPGDSG
jgi:hypothetical protein